MRLLCVDFGNICRGPLAEAVLRHRLGAAGVEAGVESAGIRIVQSGDPPDPRAIAAAERRGYDLTRIRCEPLSDKTLTDFERVLVVDRTVFSAVEATMRHANVKLHRLRFLHPDGVEIPDPFDGNRESFEQALDLIEEAAEGIVTSLSNRPWPQKPR